jgi:glycosyltransferase involved in cell wall biosynthesis
MDVSVVIPCYNAARWIRTTLQSVWLQQGCSFEVIVVDDGSSDASAAIVAQEFPAVRLIRTANHGPSRARTTGTQSARGACIQYLDADDLLAPGKLARQLQLLAAEQAEVAYGDWQRLETQPDGMFRPGRIVSRRLSAQADIDLFTGFWCPPAAYLFRRAIVERIGPWHEGLPVIQDARFALDCALQGARFAYCPEVVAFYRVHRAGSVSRRSAIAFNRDVFRNACDVDAWWRMRGGLSAERRAALLRVYGQAARGSYGRDPATFAAAYRRLEQLQPGYIPPAPRSLALLSRLFGYRRAEALAWWYRRGKQMLRRRRPEPGRP